MTRVARILRDKLRRRFAPVVLLRSGKHQPPQSQYAADHTSSTSLFPPFVFSDTQHPLRLFHPRIAHNPARCSRILVASGARPFSRFGGPSKQPVSRPLRREFRIQSSSQSTYLQQSSLSSWAVVVLAGLISGLVFYTTSPSNVERLEEKDSADSRNLLKGQSNENRHNMAVESLPGRPGTLTPAEEEKLRELWIATLQVFGILDAQEAAEPANGTAKTDAKKSKKKRMSLFRRGHKDEDTSSTTSTESGSRVPSGSGDSDDKYGQTKEFQEALANLSPEAIRAAFWSMVKHDHPDGLLLRFLRARKWDVEKALVMMVSTMRWRSGEMHVDDDIMLNGELAAVLDANGTDPEKKKAGNDFMSQMRMGKSFLHGLDKEGRPMCFVRVRFHKQGEQAEEALERYTVFVIESARLLLAPPVDTACVVFDMTGFSMANMDYAPLKFIIKCFEANYPESLGVVLVHKAPWVFQGIWKIIKGWLDPVVASKVHFTNSNQEMEQFVPASNIIKELDGDEDWAYKYIEPVPGENDAIKDTETRDKLLAERQNLIKEYENVTLDWIRGKETNPEIIKATRNELANKLRDDYWRLDPFIRARSYYDRIGMINPGGRIQFYPGKTPASQGPSSATPNGVKPVETSENDLD